MNRKKEDEATPKEVVEPKKKFSWKTVLIVLGIIVVVFVVLGAMEMRKMGNLQKAMMAQKEAQIESWKEQGLTEKEIQQKLENVQNDQADKAFRNTTGFKVMIFVGSIIGVDESNHPPISQ